jgi:hypothetical protein
LRESVLNLAHNLSIGLKCGPWGGRQRRGLCCGRDQSGDLRPLAARQVATTMSPGLSSEYEELLDVGFKGDGVDGPSRTSGATRPSRSRPATKGVAFQWPWGDRRSQPPAFGRMSTAARQLGGGPGLVDEDQLLRVEPSPATLQDVGALLPGGLRGLFLGVSWRRSKTARSSTRRTIAGFRWRCLKLSRRRVRLLGQNRQDLPGPAL